MFAGRGWVGRATLDQVWPTGNHPLPAGSHPLRGGTQCGRRGCVPARGPAGSARGHRLWWGGSGPGRVATAGLAYGCDFRRVHQRLTQQVQQGEDACHGGEAAVDGSGLATSLASNGAPALSTTVTAARRGCPGHRARTGAGRASSILAPSSSTAKTTSADPSMAAACCSPVSPGSAVATTVSAPVASAPASSVASTTTPGHTARGNRPASGTGPLRHGSASGKRRTQHQSRTTANRSGRQ